jgi:hypothetical protein
MAWDANVGIDVLLKAPRYALPMAVLAVDTITASVTLGPTGLLANLLLHRLD